MFPANGVYFYSEGRFQRLRSTKQMAVKVAVVGAGVAGLSAMKNFTEDGFDVTTYETRDYVGGLVSNTFLQIRLLICKNKISMHSNQDRG